MEFQVFRKIPRLRRACCLTEKLDGTNAQIAFDEAGTMHCGSRSRWLTPGQQTDNYGFAAWCHSHYDELVELGEGRHYGEWWGQGIQRNYGLDEKRFSLFNTNRWGEHNPPPACCHVVPVLYQGLFDSDAVLFALEDLELYGSVAAPGYLRPEGVVVYHMASRQYFKQTIEDDEVPKGVTAAADDRMQGVGLEADHSHREEEVACVQSKLSV